MGEDGRPRSLADSAAGGGSGVSRRGDVAGGAARAAAPASAEIEPAVQQPPGSAPSTPEAPGEAAAVAELWCRAAGQAGDGQAPAATAPSDCAPAAAKAALCVAPLDHSTLRCVHSFVHCVAGSALVQSALLYLEHEGEHPPALPASEAAAGPAGRGAAAGLEWTLAKVNGRMEQRTWRVPACRERWLATACCPNPDAAALRSQAILVAHPHAAARPLAAGRVPARWVRAALAHDSHTHAAELTAKLRCPTLLTCLLLPPTTSPPLDPHCHCAARESALLGALWVLEAAHSAWRSPASVVLPAYTKLVGAVSSEVRSK